MSDRALVDTLSLLLATETRSLARHLTEATPYLSLPVYAIWTSLKHLSAKTVEHARQLGDVCNSLSISPRSISHSPDVAYYHYVGLERLLPELIVEKERQVEAYEQAIKLTADMPRVQEVLRQLQQENNEHLYLLRQAMAKLQLVTRKHGKP